jgi:hypothetical protein
MLGCYARGTHDLGVCPVLAGTALGLILQHRLYERLRREHPKAMETLAGSSAGIMAFPRYFWRRHYLGLGDALFNQRAEGVRRYWKGWFMYFLLVVLALIVALAVGT